MPFNEGVDEFNRRDASTRVGGKELRGSFCFMNGCFVEIGGNLGRGDFVLGEHLSV